MKITRRVVFDIETWQILELEQEPNEYPGPWDECKGGNSKQAAADAKAQRDMENQQWQQQLAMQQKQLDMVNPTVQRMISAGGLLPEQEARLKGLVGDENQALTALLMNNLPNTFRNAAGNVNQALVARGVSGGQWGAGSGDIARGFGQLGALEGSMQQEGLSQAALQKFSGLRDIEGMRMQGLQGAMNTALGIGGMYGQNVGTFNQGASSALGNQVTAANNADQAQTGFMGSLVSGLTGMAKFKPICWIAAAVYGESDPRVSFIRARLLKRAAYECRVFIVLVAYLLLGKPVAWIVRRSGMLQLMFRGILDRFLRHEKYGY